MPLFEITENIGILCNMHIMFCHNYELEKIFRAYNRFRLLNVLVYFKKKYINIYPPWT